LGVQIPPGAPKLSMTYASNLIFFPVVPMFCTYAVLFLLPGRCHGVGTSRLSFSAGSARRYRP
jgi:hypothetical protein